MPSALAVFACRPNSHPFQERHVYLDEPVKIGRSVARCRPAQNNATFDCKVLSRNHALVWFDHKTGKFYLQDTKSSNGTFINSQRLSRGSEESPPCEVLSGDIIQFGVDVTENTRKVTHGCIVSTIKLFLPDGMEARRRSDVIQPPLPLPVDKVAANTPSMYSQELFQLSQYLQEALHREQMLEQKLATLQRLLATTQEASESSWQALIDEDRLLSRLEVMGSHKLYCTEEGIRKELLALQEDKHNYETTAKESLRRVLQEKIEVVRKLSEVERSLSNTEDECTHLKEMSERSQEELRELANKYNAAVNEIKELTDKIKAAEGRQEELTQRGATEKRELELRIEEMEEKEQVLQARIEALQADNDFTNERLAALQVRLEQLQEKSIKENNSLGESICLWSSLGHSSSSPLFVFLWSPSSLFHPALMMHDDFLHDVHITSCWNQMDAKESDMSDTLSPSKDRSSDDTSDGNMDDQELNEPQNRVALLKGNKGSSSLLCKQVIHHLHRELLEAQELANTGKQKCLELQALLEEEKRTNSKQTEESTKQIQYLQTQLGKLQADMEALREQRESTICTTREELYSAQEEIFVLRHAMDNATTEREREIAALQADLGTVRLELEHWRNTASKYEEEISRLQEAFTQQQQQQTTANNLQGEHSLSDFQKKHTELSDMFVLYVFVCSTREQSLVLSSSLVSLEKREEVLQDKLGSLENQHLQDASRLKSQLDQAQALLDMLHLCVQYEDTQSQLLDLRQRYERTEQEKLNIHQELEQCRSSLKLLQDKTSSVSKQTQYCIDHMCLHFLLLLFFLLPPLPLLSELPVFTSFSSSVFC
uniref:Sarcolemmal membrane-associated protein n=1 Tax=Anabas testudineus TaxID=64144 RepID=A0A3Q1HB05_ANATE